LFYTGYPFFYIKSSGYEQTEESRQPKILDQNITNKYNKETMEKSIEEIGDA